MEKRQQRRQNVKIVRKKSRMRKARIVFSFFLAIFFLLGGYAVYQYYSGKSLAAQGIIEPEYEFNGQKDEKGKVNVLLIGADHRKKGEPSNSDTIMIAQYHPSREKAKIVSIMRDIYAPIPGYQDNKINASFLLGGPDLLRQTIKENFNIDVEYYVVVDFKGFEKAIDALAPAGIEIDVEKAMSKYIGVSLQPGLQKLNGKELLGYARFRQDLESDFGRVRRQQQVIKAISNEIISANGIAKAPKLLGTVQPYIQTNIGAMDSLSLLKDFLFFDTKNIETLTLPIEGSYTNERLQDRRIILKTDFEMNTKAIQEFLEG